MLLFINISPIFYRYVIDLQLQPIEFEFKPKVNN